MALARHHHYCTTILRRNCRHSAARRRGPLTSAATTCTNTLPTTRDLSASSMSFLGWQLSAHGPTRCRSLCRSMHETYSLLAPRLSFSMCETTSFLHQRSLSSPCCWKCLRMNGGSCWGRLGIEVGARGSSFQCIISLRTI